MQGAGAFPLDAGWKCIGGAPPNLSRHLPRVFSCQDFAGLGGLGGGVCYWSHQSQIRPWNEVSDTRLSQTHGPGSLTRPRPRLRQNIGA